MSQTPEQHIELATVIGSSERVFAHLSEPVVSEELSYLVGLGIAGIYGEVCGFTLDVPEAPQAPLAAFEHEKLGALRVKNERVIELGRTILHDRVQRRADNGHCASEPHVWQDFRNGTGGEYRRALACKVEGVGVSVTICGESLNGGLVLVRRDVGQQLGERIGQRLDPKHIKSVSSVLVALGSVACADMDDAFAMTEVAATVSGHSALNSGNQSAVSDCAYGALSKIHDDPPEVKP